MPGPSPPRDDGFDEGAYLALNPDLAAAFAAGLIETGLAHWRESGEAETRAGDRPVFLDAAAAPDGPRPVPRPDPADALDGFDAAAYLAMNPDIAAAFGGDHAAAVRHWVEHGRLEGRHASGDAPYRDRSVSLDRLLARPFGVDLHLPALESGIEGAAGRQLLAALRAAGLPVSVRPYDDRGDIPRLTAAAAGRPPAHRVSLFVATPFVLRALQRMLPAAVFDETYVVAVAPRLGLAAHMTDHPTFGMVDELWVASEPHARLLASVAPCPVRHLALPPRALAPRSEARRLLGLPPDGIVLAVDASETIAGPGGGRLLPEVEAAIARFRSRAAAGGDAPPPLLLLRATPGTAGLADAALRDVAQATFRCDPDRPGEGSLVFAAADAVLHGEAIAHELAGHEARLRVATLATMAAVLRGEPPPSPGPTRACTPAVAGARVRAILAALGLDLPRPAFATAFGRTRGTALPRAGAEQSRPAPGLPVLSLVFTGEQCDRPTVLAWLDALDAQAYPFWELCIGGWTAPDPRDRRACLPADPRLRLVPGPGAPWAASTGDLLLPVADAASVRRRIEQLAVLAALVARDDPDLVVAADPAASATVFVDTIEGGGPAATPIAIRRRLLDDGAAPDLDLLVLRAARAGARIASLADPAPPPRDPRAEERGRRARLRHARAALGPSSFVEPGFAPATWRMRRCWPAGVRPVVCRLPATALLPPGTLVAVLRAAAAEHVVLLWDGVEPEGDAVAALAELLLDDGIGAAGGSVLHPNGTVAAAAWVQAPDGPWRAPGRDLPPAFGGEADATLRVRNVDAVGGGCIAVRRSALPGLAPPDLAAAASDAEAQASALCSALREEAGLRVVTTPFARFRRMSDEARLPAPGPWGTWGSRDGWPSG